MDGGVRRGVFRRGVGIRRGRNGIGLGVIEGWGGVVRRKGGREGKG